ncbi:hypothetical protein E2C01_040652 [Portunus trituberculatus]|uniref:Uncharacterized protein n=1 Tax=Portunus trituberculatus TaxID=210409 RepID=A0A5B7FHZ5_PORTR|nr:hypothetical protein [Portunus trituberculatus]
MCGVRRVFSKSSKLRCLGNQRQPGGEGKMSQDSEDVSTGNQTEEYDEPTVESDPEEEPRGENTNRLH